MTFANHLLSLSQLESFDLPVSIFTRQKEDHSTKNTVATSNEMMGVNKEQRKGLAHLEVCFKLAAIFCITILYDFLC